MTARRLRARTSRCRSPSPRCRSWSGPRCGSTCAPSPWSCWLQRLVATLLTAQGHGPFGAASPRASSPLELAGALVQGYLLCATLMSLPLTVAVDPARRACWPSSRARERLFRRNFTESLTGMLLLRAARATGSRSSTPTTPPPQLLGDERQPAGRPLPRPGARHRRRTLRRDRGRMLAGDLDGWAAQLGLAAPPRSRVDVALSLLSGGRRAGLRRPAARRHRRARRPRPARGRRAADQRHPGHRRLHHHGDRHGRHGRPRQRGRPPRSPASPRTRSSAARCGRRSWPPHRRAGRRRRCSPEPDGPAEPRHPRGRRAHPRPARSCGWSGTTTSSATRTARPAYAVMTGIDVTAERTTAGLMTTCSRRRSRRRSSASTPAAGSRCSTPAPSTLLGYDRRRHGRTARSPTCSTPRSCASAPAAPAPARRSAR